jgi:hypothetical protein
MVTPPKIDTLTLILASSGQGFLQKKSPYPETSAQLLRRGTLSALLSLMIITITCSLLLVYWYAGMMGPVALVV